MDRGTTRGPRGATDSVSRGRCPSNVSSGPLLHCVGLLELVSLLFSSLKWGVARRPLQTCVKTNRADPALHHDNRLPVLVTATICRTVLPSRRGSGGVVFVLFRNRAGFTVVTGSPRPSLPPFGCRGRASPHAWRVSSSSSRRVSGNHPTRAGGRAGFTREPRPLGRCRGFEPRALLVMDVVVGVCRGCGGVSRRSSNRASLTRAFGRPW